MPETPAGDPADAGEPEVTVYRGNDERPSVNAFLPSLGEKRCQGGEKVSGEKVSGPENAGQHRRQPGRGGCVSGGQTGRGYAFGGRTASGVGGQK